MVIYTYICVYVNYISNSCRVPTSAWKVLEFHLWSPWNFEQREQQGNAKNSTAGCDDRHRFHENYADDIQKYTNYIDEVVAGIRNIDMINRQLLLACASARQKYDVYLEKQNVQKHELFLQRKRFLPRDAMLSHYMLSSCVRPSTVCHKSEFYNDG